MKKKVWKIIVLIGLVLTIAVAQATVLAEEEDIPNMYSIVIPFTTR